MSQEKDNPNNSDNTIDNEQVTPVGEPFSDEISPICPLLMKVMTLIS
ncbi:MAG: hypothetical protein IPP34_03585 [Bacteroidetes bacterium]|nr:hypothetical protein [Bacteroidota bacterium]